ncbi:hypothetical protein GIB67_005173 [Kingdonia uniflora]|uniref:Protein POLLEN DEFECTIVE IN GUIDANCE 1 n=1 Tax=Kingdonia uniflora TaxID=39325 RepID=A0A7J7NMW2_9MAGN|nr:hypothetical protein GIB67_005173 [Kingdonia uniflora]
MLFPNNTKRKNRNIAIYRNHAQANLPLQYKSTFLLQLLTTMAFRSRDRNLSFEILNIDEDSIYDEPPLTRTVSEPISSINDALYDDLNRRKKRNRRSKKKKRITIVDPIEEDDSIITEKRVDAVFDDDRGGETSSFCANEFKFDYSSVVRTVVCEEIRVSQELEFQKINVSGGGVELRQRSVNGSVASGGVGFDDSAFMEDERGEVNSSVGQWRTDSNGNGSSSVGGKLETEKSLDWKQIMAKDPTYLSSMEKSPLKYFMGEMSSGNSLRSTTTLGNEKERERVYDTIFRLPWRCELLIDVGYFVCLDTFLSLLTIMPARIMITVWRFVKTRRFQRPSAAELADFSCFIVLAFGVTLLQRTDISLIYHMIRGQGTIKLYVVYNVLEIFDKLCQNFGGDVLQTLFNSTDRIASCSQENVHFWLRRFICDQVLAAIASNILLSLTFHFSQAITLSTCIVAHNNALLALLVSNNFAEIKSNVFKRFSKDNIHNLVYHGIAISTIAGIFIESQLIRVSLARFAETSKPPLLLDCNFSLERSSFKPTNFLLDDEELFRRQVELLHEYGKMMIEMGEAEEKEQEATSSRRRFKGISFRRRFRMSEETEIPIREDYKFNAYPYKRFIMFDDSEPDEDGVFFPWAFLFPSSNEPQEHLEACSTSKFSDRDSVERFHISSFILFVLAQNILEGEHPWFGSFLYNAFQVYMCEVIIDIIKHSFIAKFNDVKPIAYSEFLEDLCNQTLNIQREDGKKNLTFVPLAPACVVIRVLTPVYATHLPYGPLPWRLLCILFLSLVTYIMLASLKVMVGMGLRKHATWYVNRCRKKKHHLHAD